MNLIRHLTASKLSKLLRLNRFLTMVAPGLAASLTMAAAPAESPFDLANRLYEQGKFAEAAKIYSKQLDAGVASPALYFNLGNALYKSAQMGQAIVAYRRVEQLTPRDPDLRANLQFARNQVQGPTLKPSRVELWIGRLTLNEWTIVFCIGLWLLLLLLVVIQLRPAYKPILRTFVKLTGGTVIFFAACLGTALSLSASETAVVIVRDAAVRNGILEESAIAFTAQPGAELAIRDRKNGWVQVQAGARVGWIKNDQIAVFRQL